LRGWVFKASLVIGAMSIGAKVHQILASNDLLKTEQRLRKQLYYLILGVKYKSFQQFLDPKSLQSENDVIDGTTIAGQNGLSAVVCKQESRWKVICRAIFGECWCWFTPEEKRNMFLSRSDTNVEDSLNDHVKRELKCHNEISGTGQIETKDSNARISNVSGERSRSHTHAAALLSSAGLSSMKGCKASKSIPYIIPTTRRKLSRYNVEGKIAFSIHPCACDK